MNFSKEDVEELQQMKTKIKRECKKYSKNELIQYVTTLLWENAQLRAENIAIKNLCEEHDVKMDSSAESDTQS